MSQVRLRTMRLVAVASVLAVILSAGIYAFPHVSLPLLVVHYLLLVGALLLLEPAPYRHAQLARMNEELQAANEELGAQQEELQAQNEELLESRTLMEAQRKQLKAALSALIATESALRTSEARFAGVLAIAGDAIISVDEHDRIVLFNRAAAEMFGCTEEAALGQSLSLLIPPGLHGHRVCPGAHGQVVRGLELTARRLDDGREFPAEASVSTLGTATEYLCTVILRDISDRRRAEQEVRDAHELREQIFASSPSGILVYDSRGQCVTVNTAATNIIGASPELLSAQNCWELPSWRQSGLYDVAAATMKTGQEAAVELLHRSTFGRSVWMDCRMRRFTLGGEPHLLVLVNDVTSRKLAEQELELFFNTSLELLGLMGFDGQFKKLSPAWAKTLGWSIAELMAQRCIDLVHPDDVEATLDMESLLRAGREVVRFENRLRCKDGSYRWVSWSAAGLPDRRLIICAARDVTDRRQFEDMLRLAKEEADMANRAKGEFLANMSHEIRTPLNAVIGFSELLSATVTDDRQRSYLDSICTAGRSLLSLIGDILDLSKAEAGLMELHPSPVHLPMLFREIETIFRPQVQGKGLHWSVQIDEVTPPGLLLDEQRLRQVMLNLVGNAVKFTEQGFVQLTASTLPAQSGTPGEVDLVISVTDSGIGIPPSEQPEIFKAFRQQSGHAGRRHGGTGLGLTISRRLAELMNGTLTLQSQPGVGSCFTVSLPGVRVVTRELGLTDTTADAEPGAVRFAPALVLVVDDVASNRQLLRDLLEQVGLRVSEAANGLEAIREAEAKRPQLILMDVRMPMMDGAQAARSIRQREALMQVPVVALTAAASDRGVRVDRSLFNGLVTKPFSRRDLLAELLRHLPTAAPELPAPQVLPPGALAALQLEALPLARKLKGAVRLADVSRLAETLSRLAEEHDAPGLAIYGSELLDRMAAMDVVAIQAVLRRLLAAAEQPNHGGMTDGG